MSKLLVSMIFLASSTVHGLQIRTVQDNARVVAEISEESINRISVEDDRIAQVFGLSEDLNVETDEEGGQIFLRTQQSKAIDLHLITEKQLTLDLHLLPKKIPGETLIIKTRSAVEPSAITAKTTSYVEQITALMLAMAGHRNLEGYALKKVNKEILLWKKIKLQQNEEYSGSQFVGEIYVLRNKTPDSIFLTKSQFTWKKGIAAVSIQKDVLAPNAQTTIYLIRHVL